MTSIYWQNVDDRNLLPGQCAGNQCPTNPLTGPIATIAHVRPILCTTLSNINALFYVLFALQWLEAPFDSVAHFMAPKANLAGERRMRSRAAICKPLSTAEKLSRVQGVISPASL